MRVRALHSAISRGTEALVQAGRVPPSEYERMRAPAMAGTFPFPVKYGYAGVGRVEAGDPASAGQNGVRAASASMRVQFRRGRRAVRCPKA